MALYNEPAYGYPCDKEGCQHNDVTCDAWVKAYIHRNRRNPPGMPDAPVAAPATPEDPSVP